nr:U5 snRNP-specific protein-like factor [Ipomoea batatas]
MSAHPFLKRPKVEPDMENGGGSIGGEANNDGKDVPADTNDQSRSEQEEALVALVEHRTKECISAALLVQFSCILSACDFGLWWFEGADGILVMLRWYGVGSQLSAGWLNNQAENRRLVTKIEAKQNNIANMPVPNHGLLIEAERRLDDTQGKLARLRGQDSITTSKSFHDNGMKKVKSKTSSMNPALCSEDSYKSQSETKAQDEGMAIRPLENKSACTSRRTELSSGNQLQGKPQLVIPDVKPKVSQPTKMTESEPKVRSGPGSLTGELAFPHSSSTMKIKGDKTLRKPSEKDADVQNKGTKRKFEQKEHKDLIPMIRTSSSPCTIRCQTCSAISSQHKRKLRSLILCPTSEQLFATSALDGVVNLWQVQSRGSANLLSTTDCLSAKHRRWPEDIAWHPEGDTIFSVYSADGGESQISILNLNKGKERMRVSFLEEKPHVRGIINNIVFMPWEDIGFVTGGSDHAVVFWTEKEGANSWKPKALHRSMHSSAVMGVAGMQHKKSVMSAGADKRIIGFDLQAQRADYNHQIDSKCMSILPNPRDFNLFMVQAGTLEKQLRLFDVRARQREVHAFGWKQESSDSQSALINQAWSPDGLYITSGSVDPVIHIFDIRYNSHKPSQSIRAHQKRVFKAVWHHSLPLLISISSDLNIGLHKVT